MDEDTQLAHNELRKEVETACRCIPDLKREGLAPKELVTTREKLIDAFQFAAKKIPAQFLLPALLSYGDRLIKLGETDIALKQCFQYVSREFMKLSPQTQALIGTPAENTAYQVRAAMGSGLCLAELAKIADKALLRADTVAAIVAALGLVKEAMNFIFGRPEEEKEKLYWLLYNGTIHLYSAARELRQAGFASEGTQFLAWCISAVEQSVVLCATKYVAWRVQLYVELCECYEHEKKFKSARKTAERGIGKLEELKKLEELDLPVPDYIRIPLDQALRTLRILQLRYRLLLSDANADSQIQQFYSQFTDPADKLKAVLQTVQIGDKRLFQRSPLPPAANDAIIRLVNFASTIAQPSVDTLLKGFKQREQKLIDKFRPPREGTPAIEAVEQPIPAATATPAAGGKDKKGTAAVVTQQQAAQVAAEVDVSDASFFDASKKLPLDLLVSLFKLAFSYEQWQIVKFIAPLLELRFKYRRMEVAAVVGVDVVVGDNESISAPTGYDKVPIDLNAAALRAKKQMLRTQGKSATEIDAMTIPHRYVFLCVKKSHMEEEIEQKLRHELEPEVSQQDKTVTFAVTHDIRGFGFLHHGENPLVAVSVQFGHVDKGPKLEADSFAIAIPVESHDDTTKLLIDSIEKRSSLTSTQLKGTDSSMPFLVLKYATPEQLRKQEPLPVVSDLTCVTGKSPFAYPPENHVKIPVDLRRTPHDLERAPGNHYVYLAYEDESNFATLQRESIILLSMCRLEQASIFLEGTPTAQLESKLSAAAEVKAKAKAVAEPSASADPSRAETSTVTNWDLDQLLTTGRLLKGLTVGPAALNFLDERPDLLLDVSLQLWFKFCSPLLATLKQQDERKVQQDLAASEVRQFYGVLEGASSLTAAFGFAHFAADSPYRKMTRVLKDVLLTLHDVLSQLNMPDVLVKVTIALELANLLAVEEDWRTAIQVLRSALNSIVQYRHTELARGVDRNKDLPLPYSTTADLFKMQKLQPDLEAHPFEGLQQTLYCLHVDVLMLLYRCELRHDAQQSELKKAKTQGKKATTTYEFDKPHQQTTKSHVIDLVISAKPHMSKIQSALLAETNQNPYERAILYLEFASHTAHKKDQEYFLAESEKCMDAAARQEYQTWSAGEAYYRYMRELKRQDQLRSTVADGGNLSATETMSVASEARGASVKFDPSQLKLPNDEKPKRRFMPSNTDVYAKVMASNTASSSASAPFLVARTPTSISLQVPFLTFKKAFKDTHSIAVYGKEAGSGVSVSINNVGFPGTGTKVPQGSIVTISNLNPNESYVFAIAPFSEDGQCIGGIGQTSAEIVTLSPLPLQLLQAYYARTAFMLGHVKKAKISAELVAEYYCCKVENPSSPVLGLSLQTEIVERSAVPALYACAECLCILADIFEKQSALPTVPGVVSHVLLPKQLAQLRVCNKLVLAVEVAVLINDAPLIKHVVSKLYNCVYRLLTFDLKPSLLFQALVKCHQAIQYVPAKLWDSNLRRIFACLCYEIVYTCAQSGELNLASSLIQNSNNEGRRQIAIANPQTDEQEVTKAGPTTRPTTMENRPQSDMPVPPHAAGPQIEIPMEHEPVSIDEYLSSLSSFSKLASDRAAWWQSKLTVLEKPSDGSVSLAASQGADELIQSAVWPLVHNKPQDGLFKLKAEFLMHKRYIEFTCKIARRALDLGGVEPRTVLSWLGEVAEPVETVPKVRAELAYLYQSLSNDILVDNLKIPASVYQQVKPPPSAPDSQNVDKKKEDSKKAGPAGRTKKPIEKEKEPEKEVAARIEPVAEVSRVADSELSLEQRALEERKHKEKEEEELELEMERLQQSGRRFASTKPDVNLWWLSELSLLKGVCVHIQEILSIPRPPDSGQSKYFDPMCIDVSKLVDYDPKPSASILTSGHSAPAFKPAMQQLLAYLAESVTLARKGAAWMQVQNGSRYVWNALRFALVTPHLCIEDEYWTYVVQCCSALLDLLQHLRNGGPLTLLNAPAACAAPDGVTNNRPVATAEQNTFANTASRVTSRVDVDTARFSRKSVPRTRGKEGDDDDVRVPEQAWFEKIEGLDADFISRFVSYSLQVLFCGRKWRHVVYVGTSFNELTSSKFAESILALIIGAQKTLLDQSLSRLHSKENELNALSEEFEAWKVTNKRRRTRQAMLTGELLPEEVEFEQKAEVLRKEIEVRRQLVEQKQQRFTSLETQLTHLKRDKSNAAESLQQCRTLLRQYTTEKMNVDSMALALRKALEKGEDDTAAAKSSGSQLSLPSGPVPTPDVSALNQVRATRKAQKILAQMVNSSYRKTIEYLRKRQERDMLVQALHELGNLCFSEGHRGDAELAWSDCVDAVFSTLYVIDNWRELFKTHSDVIKSFGLFNCLQAAVVLGKLAELSYHDNCQKRLEACLMARHLFTAPFSCSILHPQTAHGFASYRVTQVIPDCDLFSDLYRLDPAQLLRSIEFVSETLIINGHAVETLALLSFHIHVAADVCKEPAVCSKGKLMKALALCDTGYIAESLQLLRQIVEGKDLPVFNRYDQETSLVRGIDWKARDKAYSNHLLPHHTDNQAAIQLLLDLTVSEPLSAVYGSTQVMLFNYVKAKMLFKLAEAEAIDKEPIAVYDQLLTASDNSLKKLTAIIIEEFTARLPAAAVEEEASIKPKETVPVESKGKKGAEVKKPAAAADKKEKDKPKREGAMEPALAKPHPKKELEPIPVEVFELLLKCWILQIQILLQRGQLSSALDLCVESMKFFSQHAVPVQEAEDQFRSLLANNLRRSRHTAASALNKSTASLATPSVAPTVSAAVSSVVDGGKQTRNHPDMVYWLQFRLLSARILLDQGRFELSKRHIQLGQTECDGVKEKRLFLCFMDMSASVHVRQGNVDSALATYASIDTIAKNVNFTGPVLAACLANCASVMDAAIDSSRAEYLYRRAEGLLHNHLLLCGFVLDADDINAECSEQRKHFQLLSALDEQPLTDSKAQEKPPASVPAKTAKASNTVVPAVPNATTVGEGKTQDPATSHLSINSSVLPSNIYLPHLELWCNVQIRLGQFLSERCGYTEAVFYLQRALKVIERTPFVLPSLHALNLLLLGRVNRLIINQKILGEDHSSHGESITALLKDLDGSMEMVEKAVQVSVAKGGHDRRLLHSAMMELAANCLLQLQSGSNHEKLTRGYFAYLETAVDVARGQRALDMNLSMFAKANLTDVNKLPQQAALEIREMGTLLKLARPTTADAVSANASAVQHTPVKPVTSLDVICYYSSLLKDLTVQPFGNRLLQILQIRLHNYLSSNLLPYKDTCNIAGCPMTLADVPSRMEVGHILMSWYSADPHARHGEDGKMPDQVCLYYLLGPDGAAADTTSKSVHPGAVQKSAVFGAILLQKKMVSEILEDLMNSKLDNVSSAVSQEAKQKSASERYARVFSAIVACFITQTAERNASDSSSSLPPATEVFPEAVEALISIFKVEGAVVKSPKLCDLFRKLHELSCDPN